MTKPHYHYETICPECDNIIDVAEIFTRGAEEGRASMLKDVEKLCDNFCFYGYGDNKEDTRVRNQFKERLSQLHNPHLLVVKDEGVNPLDVGSNPTVDSQAKQDAHVSNPNPAPRKGCSNCGEITLTGKSGLCFRCFVRFKDESKPQPKSFNRKAEQLNNKSTGCGKIDEKTGEVCHFEDLCPECIDKSHCPICGWNECSCQQKQEQKK